MVEPVKRLGIHELVGVVERSRGRARQEEEAEKAPRKRNSTEPDEKGRPAVFACSTSCMRTQNLVETGCDEVRRSGMWVKVLIAWSREEDEGPFPPRDGSGGGSVNVERKAKGRAKYQVSSVVGDGTGQYIQHCRPARRCGCSNNAKFGHTRVIHQSEGVNQHTDSFAKSQSWHVQVKLARSLPASRFPLVLGLYSSQSQHCLPTVYPDLVLWTNVPYTCIEPGSFASVCLALPCRSQPTATTAAVC